MPAAVFAVRDLGCAMCHASVSSDIITDMMAGSDPYTEHQALESWMQNYDTPKTPETTVKPFVQKIDGTVFIPKSTIRHDGATGQTHSASTTGANGRCVSKLKFDDKVATNSATPIDILTTMQQCADSYITWGPDSRHFEAIDRVEIDPPTSADAIRELSLKNPQTQTRGGITYLSSFHTKSRSTEDRFPATQSGFQVQNNRIEITGDVSCEGGLLLEQPVYIHDATITTSEGCRIHSTQSIFIQNSVTVKRQSTAQPEDNAALMLLSPTFIGLHASMGTIRARNDHDTIKHRVYRAGKASDLLSRIVDDHTAAAIPEFVDGGKIDYSRIVLVAPIVHSRSKGNFSGAIVAEQFIGAIGTLTFQFDPVLKKAPFFPEFVIDARGNRNMVIKGSSISDL